MFDQSREIIIALDLSRSMLAPDVRPSRLERARLLIQGLLDGLRGRARRPRGVRRHGLSPGSLERRLRGAQRVPALAEPGVHAGGRHRLRGDAARGARRLQRRRHGRPLSHRAERRREPDRRTGGTSLDDLRTEEHPRDRPGRRAPRRARSSPTERAATSRTSAAPSCSRSSTAPPCRNSPPPPTAFTPTPARGWTSGRC